MMKFPLSRTEISSAAYTHKLLLALTKALMKSCGGVSITQAEMDAVEPDDTLIAIADGNIVTLKHGSARSQVFLIPTPKDEPKWTNPNPNPTPEFPDKGLTPAPDNLDRIPPQNSMPSSPRSPQRPITPLPAAATPAPKDKLDALGRPKVSAQTSPEDDADQDEYEDEETSQTNQEMAPATEEELLAIEQTMDEAYQEPEQPLPTSPIEEILESQQGDQTVLPPRHLSSRRAMLDDMSLFLKETAMNAKRDQKAEEAAMILRNREGLLPFKARKDNPLPKGRRNRS